MSYTEGRQQLRVIYAQAQAHFEQEAGITSPKKDSSPALSALGSKDFVDLLHPPENFRERAIQAKIASLSTQVARGLVLGNFLGMIPLAMDALSFGLPRERRQIKFDTAEAKIPKVHEDRISKLLGVDVLAEIYSRGKKEAIAYTSEVLAGDVPLMPWKREVLEPRLLEMGIEPRPITAESGIEGVVLPVPTGIVGVDMAYQYMGGAAELTRFIEVRRLPLPGNAERIIRLGQLLRPPQPPASD